MAATSIFPGIIPPSNFELIRDQIGRVLAFELTMQQTRDVTFVAPTVFIERMFAIDSATECPVINVNYGTGNYNGKNQDDTQGEYTFNVDIYTNSPTIINLNDSEQDIAGDKEANIKMQRIAGMVRAILDSYCYYDLAFVAFGFPKIVIENIKVIGFAIGNKYQVPDALADVIGRLQVQVTCRENNQLLTNTNIVEGVDVHITQENGPAGYYFTVNLKTHNEDYNNEYD